MIFADFRKIDFATASPIKTKLLTRSADAPSPARRRLDLSDEETSYDTQKVNVVEETHPAITSVYRRPMHYGTGDDKSTVTGETEKELRARRFKVISLDFHGNPSKRSLG